jgi:hypothetical protein
MEAALRPGSLLEDGGVGFAPSSNQKVVKGTALGFTAFRKSA